MMESSKSNAWCGFKSRLGNHGCAALRYFFKTHIIKRSFTLQGQMQIL